VRSTGRTAVRGARRSGVTGFLCPITERPLIAGLGRALVKVTLARFHYTAAASQPSTETLAVDQKVVRRKLIQRLADWFPVKVHLWNVCQSVCVEMFCLDGKWCESVNRRVDRGSNSRSSDIGRHNQT
jgi:hypothetical protein